MHDTNEIDNETGKPIVIMDYNATKSGVDTVDQKCANYSTKRKTRRWPMAVFYRFLDMNGVDAHVPSTANNLNNPNAKKTRMDFLEAFSLLENHFKERTNVKNLPLDIKAFLANYKKEPQNPRPVVQANIRRSGPCHECGKHRNNKTTIHCSQCQRFMCKTHSNTRVSCNSCDAEDDVTSEAAHAFVNSLYNHTIETN